MKKRILLAIVLTFIISTLVACGGSSEDAGNDQGGDTQTTEAAGETEKQDDSSADKIIMKISHVSAPGSARDLACHALGDAVEELTKGRIEAQVYPSSQLGGQRDQVEGVQFGTIEVAVVPTSYLGGAVPMMTMLDASYLLPEDPEELYELYQSDAIKMLRDKTQEQKMYCMAIWQTGYKQWSANKPILTPDDMDGLKIRVMNSPVQFKQAEVLGASPITMDFGETYSALQNGAIDGQENPIDTIYDMKFHEVQSNITITNHAGLDQVVIINMDWFDGLDQDIQDAIVKGVEEGGIVCKDDTLRLAEEATQAILDTGETEIKVLTDEEKEVWREATEPVREFARSSQGPEGEEIYDAIVKERIRISGR